MPPIRQHLPRLTLRLHRDDTAALPLVGPSRTMRELSRQVDLLAGNEATTTLLLGEVGIGKGYVAEYIHSRSPRGRMPFIEIDCSAARESELGEELFGDDGEPGLLAHARGGTLLLTEVGDLPHKLQARLSALLDRRSGPARAATAAEVRIIAAASHDLVSEVEQGRFDERLYYKLTASPVHLPPLRARSHEDLSDLVAAVFDVFSARLPHAARTLSKEAADCLAAHAWPGNLRELRNAIERALIVSRGEQVVARVHLPQEVRQSQDEQLDMHTPRTLVDVERAHIHRTLRAHKLNRTHAARELGISRATLIKKIKQYGLTYRTSGGRS